MLPRVKQVTVPSILAYAAKIKEWQVPPFHFPLGM